MSRHSGDMGRSAGLGRPGGRPLMPGAPSWSVRVIAGVGQTKIGLMIYSGSPPS